MVGLAIRSRDHGPEPQTHPRLQVISWVLFILAAVFLVFGMLQ